jgi:prepilin-type N-terminal cleavage/methylation domain-containing protein
MNPKNRLRSARRDVGEVFNLAVGSGMPSRANFKARLKTSPTAAFTLLEMVVVLAILAIVTAMATRVISHVEDQRRFESSQHGLDELRDAVLGSPEDRAADGTRTVSGFVADMGRLPHTVLSANVDGNNTSALTLQELWVPPLQPADLFNLRFAIVDNGVPLEERDMQVRVPGGWHGPYLQLSTGAHTFTDGWGNGYISPTVPGDPDLSRLCEVDGTPINGENTTIGLVRNLGANNISEVPGGNHGYDEDQIVAFTADRYVATELSGEVEVLDEDHSIIQATGDTVTVKLFAPDPFDPSKIIIFKTTDLPVTPDSKQVSFTISAGANPNPLTIGPRVIRAYYKQGTSDATRASVVKTVTLRPGVNRLGSTITIDRSFTRLPPVTP